MNTSRFTITTVVENGYPHYKVYDNLTDNEIHCDLNELNETIWQLLGVQKGCVYMCYKDEVQRKNTEKLQRKFDEDNTPGFIQKYFINIESKAGAINYYIAIKDLLLWLMENKTINRDNIAEITPDDFYNGLL